MIENNGLYFEIGKPALLFLLIMLCIYILQKCLKKIPLEKNDEVEEKNIDKNFLFYFTHFEPNQGLERQPPFWASIFIPVILFVCTGLFAWWGTSPNFSAKGFNTFLSISQLPISLLALAIPFAVLTGRIHGTKQTALQIEKTEKKILETQQRNKTDLYLAHYKHFSERIDNISESYSEHYLFQHDVPLKFKKDVIYKQLFPKSSLVNGYTKRNEEFFASIIENFIAVDIILNDLKGIHYKENSEHIDPVINFTNEIDKIFQKLCVNSSLSKLFSPIRVKHNGSNVNVIAVSYHEMHNIAQLTLDITQSIYFFELPPTSSTSRYLLQHTFHNLDNTPENTLKYLSKVNVLRRV